MKAKPASITRPEARPAPLGMPPKGCRRPVSWVRAKAPRTVMVTLEDVINALQDCTDNDELVVIVISNLLHTGLLRSLPRFQMMARSAAA